MTDYDEEDIIEAAENFEDIVDPVSYQLEELTARLETAYDWPSYLEGETLKENFEAAKKMYIQLQELVDNPLYEERKRDKKVLEYAEEYLKKTAENTDLEV